MQKKAAELISKILSPYIVAFLTIMIVSYKASGQNFYETLRWSLIIIILVVILPFLYIFLKVKSGKLTDVHVRVREQRHTLYAIGAVAVSACIALLLFLNAPKAIIAMLVAVIFSNAIGFTINKFWKISVHSAALAGALVIFYILFGLPALIISLVLLFLGAWSRVELKEHSLSQVFAGSLVAALITFLVFKSFGF